MFLHDFVNLQAREIVLTGGEPLLHPNIIQILDYAGTSMPSIPVVVTTNGTLIGKELVRVYEKYPNLAIQLSLDGCQKTTHESQHGKNTFSTVIDAIKALYRIPKSRKIIRMTISKLNYNEAVDVAKIAMHYDCRIDYSFVCKAGRAIDNWNLLEMSTAQMVAVNEEIRQFGVLNPLEGIVPPKSIQSCPFEDSKYVFGLNIAPSGAASVCTCLGAEYIIGNAYEESLKAIINSTKIDELREKINRRKQLLKSTKCIGCAALQKCQQGCIGRAARNGNEMDLDDQCNFRRALQFKNLFLFSENHNKTALNTGEYNGDN